MPIKSYLFYHFSLPASPPIIDDLESQPSQPQPSSSNTTSESQSSQPPSSPEAQRNNVLDDLHLDCTNQVDEIRNSDKLV